MLDLEVWGAVDFPVCHRFSIGFRSGPAIDRMYILTNLSFKLLS